MEIRRRMFKKLKAMIKSVSNRLQRSQAFGIFLIKMAELWDKQTPSAPPSPPPLIFVGKKTECA